MAAAAPIRPLLWEPSYAVGAAFEGKKKKGWEKIPANPVSDKGLESKLYK